MFRCLGHTVNDFFMVDDEVGWCGWFENFSSQEAKKISRKHVWRFFFSWFVRFVFELCSEGKDESGFAIVGNNGNSESENLNLQVVEELFNAGLKVFNVLYIFPNLGKNIIEFRIEENSLC